MLVALAKKWEGEGSPSPQCAVIDSSYELCLLNSYSYGRDVIAVSRGAIHRNRVSPCRCARDRMVRLGVTGIAATAAARHLKYQADGQQHHEQDGHQSAPPGTVGDPSNSEECNPRQG